jgi:hypothetical protein
LERQFEIVREARKSAEANRDGSAGNAAALLDALCDEVARLNAALDSLKSTLLAVQKERDLHYENETSERTRAEQWKERAIRAEKERDEARLRAPRGFASADEIKRSERAKKERDLWEKRAELFRAERQGWEAEAKKQEDRAERAEHETRCLGVALDATVERAERAEKELADEARLRIKDCEDRNAYKRRADIAEAALAAALEREGRLTELAKQAKSQAASPDYDEEAIRYLLWALVDAVLADDAGETE